MPIRFLRVTNYILTREAGLLAIEEIILRAESISLTIAGIDPIASNIAIAGPQRQEPLIPITSELKEHLDAIALIYEIAPIITVDHNKASIEPVATKHLIETTPLAHPTVTVQQVVNHRPNPAVHQLESFDYPATFSDHLGTVAATCPAQYCSKVTVTSKTTDCTVRSRN